MEKTRNFTAEIIFALLLLIFLITAFAAIYNKAPDNDRNYILHYRDLMFEDIDTSIRLPYPSMSEKYYNKIGELYAPLVSFYDEDIQEYYDFYQAVPHLATSKYLSVLAEFHSNDNVRRFYSINSSITIDLENEKTVSLSDLVDINEEFIELMRNGNIIKSDESESYLKEFWDYRDYFSKFEAEEVKNMLDLCSVPVDAENARNKDSFFLSPGRLYIVGHDKFDMNYNTFFVYIDLDDIGKFLKVDKW